MKRRFLWTSLAVGATLCLAPLVQADPVPVANPSFQLPDPGADGNADDEDAYDVGNGNAAPSNWTFTSFNDNYGQQRPDPDGHFTRDVTGGETSPFTQGGFDGDLIMFANLNSAGATHQGDSDVLGQIAAGIYTLTVAVGGRDTGSWNDLNYTIGLVGSTSGPLGTPTAATINPGNSDMNSVAPSSWTTDEYNVVDLSYQLNVPGGSGLIGENYFVRITAENSGFHDGVEDTDFTQAAYDNVRVDFVVPEPSSIALLGSALLMGVIGCRKQRA